MRKSTMFLVSMTLILILALSVTTYAQDRPNAKARKARADAKKKAKARKNPTRISLEKLPKDVAEAVKKMYARLQQLDHHSAMLHRHLHRLLRLFRSQRDSFLRLTSRRGQQAFCKLVVRLLLLLLLLMLSLVDWLLLLLLQYAPVVNVLVKMDSLETIATTYGILNISHGVST